MFTVPLPRAAVPIDGYDVIVWSFDEGSGTSWTNKGNGGTLTLVPRTGFTTTPSVETNHTVYNNGIFCPGNLTNGSSRATQLNYAASAADGSGTTIGAIGTNITISLYVYLLDYQIGGGGGTGGANYGSMISKNFDTGTANTVIQVNYNQTGDGSWYVGINAGGTNQYFGPSVVAAQKIPLNKWTHIGFTYDGTNLREYFNGALVLTQAMSPSGAIQYNGSGGSWCVGGNLNVGWNCIHGYIDEVRVANVVRGLTYFQGMAP